MRFAHVVSKADFERKLLDLKSLQRLSLSFAYEATIVGRHRWANSLARALLAPLEPPASMASRWARSMAYPALFSATGSSCIWPVQSPEWNSQMPVPRSVSSIWGSWRQTSKGRHLASYTTFFVCEPQVLTAGFPGWRPPLPKPVRREFKNPFTGETTAVLTREPEWPDGEEADLMERGYQVVAIEGNYEDYLERRIPQFIRDQPHWCTKNLTEVELKPLAEAVGLETSLDFDCPLYGPLSLGAVIQGIPPILCAKLLALDETDLVTVAGRWAATMSTPNYTHSVSGEKLSAGWTAEKAMSVLQPIVKLAKEAIGGKGIFLLIEA